LAQLEAQVSRHRKRRPAFDQDVWSEARQWPPTIRGSRARAALWQEYLRPHKLVVAVASKDEVCRSFRGRVEQRAGVQTSVDDPRRFRRSKTVGAYLGLTAKRQQSGTSIDVSGHISRAGDGEVRHPLYEAAANIKLTRIKASAA
jgi:transposase